MTATASGTLRERIVAAAAEVTLDHGWSAVTMARLADAVGVSRQTVYNEVGGKPALAEAMVLAELDRFLGVVVRAFDDHPTDLVAAIEGATAGVLRLASGNDLLKAVVSATHGADTELLPLLTTHAGSLLETARLVVTERVRGYDVTLGEELEPAIDPAIDMVVRVVLSHVMQPSGTPEQTAADLAHLVSRVLR